MKRLIFILITTVLPLTINAQTAGLFGSSQTKTAKKTDFSAYEQGKLPTQDGKVVFSKTFDASGKTKAQIYRILASWASARYMPEVENGKWNDPDYFRNTLYSTVRQADEQAGRIVCQGSEEQVFSNKVLSKDFTEMEYQLSLNIKDGQVTATINNIVYKYTFASTLERRPAEEVITDDYAFTKKGKWLKPYRKFRVKTMDLANELFREIQTSIE